MREPSSVCKGAFFLATLALIEFVCIDPSVGQITLVNLKPIDSTIGDQFGICVSISKDFAVIGARTQSGTELSSGSVYVFQYKNESWIQQAKLKAPDPWKNDFFGTAIDISGDIIAIGAHTESHAGIYCGAAYIFERTGDTWNQTAKLVAPDAMAEDHFGFRLSVSGDTVLVGAPGDDDAGDSAGSAYIFSKSGSVWEQKAKIQSHDAEAEDGFGVSVCISGDTAIIGADEAAAPYDTGMRPGSAYIFARTSGGWHEQAKLTASDASPADRFGQSVAIDGDTAIVGSTRDDNESTTNSGSIYIFERSQGVWTQQQKIEAPDNLEGLNFGSSLAISSNGMVIGCNNYFYDDPVTRQGSAYAFTDIGHGWTQKAKLTAPDSFPNNRFGISCAIDAEKGIIGMYNRDRAGSAYAFSISSVTQADHWTLYNK